MVLLRHPRQAVEHLKKAAAHWKNYARIGKRQYRSQLLSKGGWADWEQGYERGESFMVAARVGEIRIVECAMLWKPWLTKNLGFRLKIINDLLLFAAHPLCKYDGNDLEWMEKE